MRYIIRDLGRIGILSLLLVMLLVAVLPGSDNASPYITAFNSNQLTPSGSSISSNGITTAAGGNVLIAIGTDNCATNGGCGTETISDTANNVWTLRTQINTGNGKSLYEYYAVSNSALSNDVVTFSSGSCQCGLMVFVVGGAKITSPFDGNSALPGITTLPTQSTSISNTINTNNANDLILAAGVQQGTSTVSISPAMTELFQDNSWVGQFAFDVTESSTLTGTTFTASWSYNNYASLLVDAFQPSSTSSTSTTSTTSTTSSTSSISTTALPIQNQTGLLDNATSIPQIFSYSFLLPLFMTLLVFMVIGIVYVDTKKPNTAIAGGFFISLIIYFYSSTLISIDVPLGLGALLTIAVLYRLFVGKRHYSD